jgi:hypothetical protein
MNILYEINVATLLTTIFSNFITRMLLGTSDEVKVLLEGLDKAQIKNAIHPTTV